ncbi:hypothetical protein AGMMS50268_19410 [Spirochaetia bacterium]|nr:hypothetical protein AGMMS50268_19410 [Spirochaetia bacterium]
MRFGLKLSILIALIAALTACPTGGDPVEVGSLTAAPADGAVTLTWTDPGVDYTAVEITFSPAAGGVTQPITVARGTNTYPISGLANGTAYTFTVKLVYSSGYKSPGTTKTATPASGYTPISGYTPAYLLPDPTNTNIAAKFGVSTVSDAFTKLHLLISTPEPGDDFTAIIRTGDYIDLPSLTVAGYPTDDATSGYGKFTVPDAELTGHGRLLRLIVVGINSFKTGGAVVNNPGAPPHVVFQFQNLPGTHRMNDTNTNVGGYKDSEMRKYLAPVDGVGGSGNFLTGLTAAGVPESVLWAPSRRVWGGSTSTTEDTIDDKLFLPTAREMFGSASNSNTTYERDNNQGRLEYYLSGNDGNAFRTKYNSGNTATAYWEASPASSNAALFCSVYTSGVSYTNDASDARGFAPVFCVK